MHSESPSPFYRVVETVPGNADNLVPNPGFEESDASPLGAASWAIAVQPNANASMRIAASFGALTPRSGGKLLIMESSTPATGPVTPPNTDVRSDRFAIDTAVTYTLSFQAAHPVKTGGANPQYSLFFYNDTNGVVGAPVFTSFSNVGGAWTKVSASVRPPAGATKLTIGWIQAMGATNAGRWVTLIDEVSLSTGPVVPDVTTILPANAADGVEVSWNSLLGINYQFQTSPGLGVWSPAGPPMAGTGALMSATAFRDGQRRFYRAIVAP
jgi:hypothetical protein